MMVKSIHDDGTFLCDKKSPPLPMTLSDFVEYAGPEFALEERDMHVYRTDDLAKARAAESATSEADVMAAGLTRLAVGDTINGGDYVVLTGTKSSARSSTTGECPTIIMLQSVARSSLTWSRCLVSPLL